jgi:hypothetical protein
MNLCGIGSMWGCRTSMTVGLVVKLLKLTLILIQKKKKEFIFGFLIKTK